MKDQDYIEKWLNGTLTDEEKNFFGKTETFARLQRMDLAVKRFQPKPIDAEAAFEKIKARRSKEAKVVSFSWGFVYRVAAVLVIGMGLLLYLNRSFFTEALLDETYQTSTGEMREVILPDHTKVTLNAMSSVSYSKKNWEKERNVTLEGEAYFDVVKGSTFRVVTHSGTVTVLGTRFTVKDRPSYYEVTCYEGRVEVKASAGPVQLTQRDFYREANGIVLQAKLDVDATPGWMRNESAFTSVPYIEVLRELERQYDVNIKTENVDTLKVFTGKFPNDNLTTALRAISVPFNLSYLVNGKEIVIFHGE